ncbi:MAG: hypothetical protein ACHQAY_11425 [Hyphomicrobiales bacterium]
MRAWLAALGLLALVAAAPAGAAPELSLGGGATVTVDGTTVTITVHIDICCFDDVGTTLAAHVMNEVRAAQDMWNKALAKLPAHGCFDVKVVFDARLLNEADPKDPGYHQVKIDFDKPGTSEDDRSWAAKGRDALQNEDDGTTYTRVLTGMFYANGMTAGTWAHEIGHFMGLGDDYREQGSLFHRRFSCLPGRGGTLMCDDKGEIDQNLADRLVDILNKAGFLPQCWKGTLKIASIFLCVKPNTCSDTWKADFRVVVNAAGSASGSGINRRASPLKAAPIVAPPVQEFPISVSGDADHVRLRLRFRGAGPASPAGSADYSRVQLVLNGTPSFATPRTYVIPVTAPGVAKGQFDISFFAQTGSIDAQLECPTCAGFGSKQ